MPDRDPTAERQPESARGRSRAAAAAALALAAGRTVEAAARKAGVSARTVYRWLKRPAFRAMVAKARGRMVDSASGLLADSMADGAAELRKLLKCKDPNVRLRASTKLIELTLRVRDQAELEERIQRLEELTGDRKGGDV